MKATRLAAQAQRQIDSLQELENRINEAPEEFVNKTIPPEEKGRLVTRSTRGIRDARRKKEVKEGVSEESRSTSNAIEEDFREMRKRVMVAGARALKKVREEGNDADFEPEEALGLEAIILMTGRPAILIQNGKFFEPPDQWKDILNPSKQKIESNLRSVGRIELTGHPTMEWVGTGFLVADDVIMTNRHVAKVFSRQTQGKWVFEKGMRVSIDYVEELGAVDSAEFSVQSIIGIHEKFDLALLKVAAKSNSGAKAPKPLTVSSNFQAKKGQRVYVLGYPAFDSRNGIAPMRKIFSDIFDVKRLQPGEIMKVLDPQSLFQHDCSTLGGNSGSCVIDLNTNQVIGLHFGGKYLEANSAVALWKLTKDQLLKTAKVNFN